MSSLRHFEDIAEERSTGTSDGFFNALFVWINKPHVVNRRLCGSKLDTVQCLKKSDVTLEVINKILQSHLLELNTSVSENFLEVAKSFDCGTTVEKTTCHASVDDVVKHEGPELEKKVHEMKEDEVVVVVRQMLPKQPERHCNIPELLILDKACHSCMFVPLKQKGESRIQEVTYCFQHETQPSIRVVLRAESADCSNDSERKLSLTWIKSHLLQKLARWSEQENLRTQVTSLRLIDVEQYSALYSELKNKYGLHFAKIWPEKTNPEKFVFEDVAIATYLLCVWSDERQRRGLSRKQSFVDLGCGNGLLVHILASEGHPGYGIDVRKRNIWDLYGPDTCLKECPIRPSDDCVFPDVDWLIGNHSDELTPWIPLIAARSSYLCSYFVLPCCFWDFTARFNFTQVGGVGTQAGGVGTQVGGVGTQAGGVGTQAGGVATQAGGVVTQAGGVGTQAGGVVTQAGGVGTQAGGVGTKAGGVGTQAGGVATQAGGVGTQAGGVGTKAGGVGTQAGGVATQAGGVGTQAGGVGTKAGGVGTQAGGVGTQAGGVGTQAGGKYRVYLDYIQHVGEVCGFQVQEDTIRIPSTKRVCFIGQSRTYQESEEASVDQQRRTFLTARCGPTNSTSNLCTNRDIDHQNHQTSECIMGDSGTKDGPVCIGETKGCINGNETSRAAEWANEFNPRSKVELTRNCVALSTEIKTKVIHTVFDAIMRYDDSGMDARDVTSETIASNADGLTRNNDLDMNLENSREGETNKSIDVIDDSNEITTENADDSIKIKSFGLESRTSGNPNDTIDKQNISSAYNNATAQYDDGNRNVHNTCEALTGGVWRKGRELTMNEVVALFDRSLLQELKSECGGLQTLLRNHCHIFQVSKGNVCLRDFTLADPFEGRNNKGRNSDKSGYKKTTLCWFHDHHPDGCPRSADQCLYAHGVDELRSKPKKMKT